MSNLNKKILLFVMLVGVAFGLVGCTNPDNSVRIYFSEDSYEVRLNETKVIEPTIIKSSQVGDVELVYSSSDESIVKVENGVLVPVAMGEATVKVAWAEKDIIFDKAVVKVVKAALPEAVLDYQAKMLEGAKQTVSVSLGNNLTEATYSFKALTPELAEVSEEGVVSAIAVGTAKFEVEVADYEESYKVEFEIVVEEADFAINYVLNGGTNDPENPVGYNALALPLPIKEATKLGYTFLGWYQGEEKVSAIAAGTLGDVELEAKWQINEYTIAFTGYDGAQFEAGYEFPAKYTVESDEIVFANPTKVGYKFLGWYAGEEKVEKIAKGSTGNVEVEAKWEAISYGIKYETEHGTLPGYATVEEAIADFLADYNTARNKSHTAETFAALGSWSEISDASLFLYSEAYRAKWAWLVDYIAAVAGKANKPAYENFNKYNSQKELNAANSNYIYEIAYELRGWVGQAKYTKNANFHSADYADAAVSGAMFDYLPVKTSYTIESEEIKFPVISEAGYEFLGWYNEADEKVEGITAGSIGDVKVIAKWEIVEYAINYDAQGGDLGFTIYTYATICSDFLADYNKLADQSLTATTFAKDSSASVKVVFANAEFLAKWSWMFAFMLEDLKAANPDATSAYLTDAYPVLEKMIAGDTAAILDNANARTMIRNYIGGMLLGAKGCPSNTTFQKYATDFADAARQGALVKAANADLELSFTVLDEVKLVVPTKDEHIFLGWYVGDQLIEKIEKGTAGDVTVVAKWKQIIRFELTWDLAGGQWAEGEEGAKEFIEDHFAEVKLPTPVNKYHNFLGWYNEAGEKVEALTANQAYKLTAKWEDLRIDGGTQYILFVLEGGNWKEGQVPGVDVTDYVEVLKLIPVKEGYEFAEWVVVSDNETNPVTIIYTATWVEVEKYAITYVLDGGENAESNPTEYTSEKLPIVLAPATKEGYEFLGWFDGETEVKEIAAGTTGALTLTAKWNKIQTEEPEQPEQPEEKVAYVGEGKDYATLDEAVQGVEDGTKIVLAAGEYTLSVKIEKSVVIEGPNADLAVAEFKAEEAVVNVTADVAGNLAAQNIEFNGVHIKGTGGGAGVPGVTFQYGSKIETLTFKSCVLSDTNTLLKLQGDATSYEILIENCHIHTIGQFTLWCTKGVSKVTLVSNVVDGSTCGAVTNAAAAIFRVRSGSLEAYNNVFNGDSLNDPGYFECSAEASVVKYNTFNDVTKFAHPTAANKLTFDENLYVIQGAAAAAAPAEVAVNGVTADATVATSETDRASRYEAAFAPEQPEQPEQPEEPEQPQSSYALTFDLAGGEWGVVPFASHEEMKSAFLADMAEYLKSLGQTLESIDPTDQKAEHLTDFFGISYAQRDNIPAFFLTHETYSAKWKWMYDYVASVSGADLSNSTVLRSNIHGFVYATIKEKWPVSHDFTQVSFGDYKDLLPASLGTQTVAPTEYAYGVATQLPVPVKEGATFDGWTLNGEAFAGITETTKGDLNLVATWK